MSIINMIIELANGEKYIVADEIRYLNKEYLLLGKVVDDDIVGELKYFEKIDRKINPLNNIEVEKVLKEITKLNVN